MKSRRKEKIKINKLFLFIILYLFIYFNSLIYKLNNLKIYNFFYYFYIFYRIIKYEKKIILVLLQPNIS